LSLPLGPWVEFRRKRPVMIAMDLTFELPPQRPPGIHGQQIPPRSGPNNLNRTGKIIASGRPANHNDGFAIKP
jgi:hypothetical protein